MFDIENVVTELSEEECRERLAGQELGRLAVSVGKHVDIFPVNFVYNQRDIFFRTAPGTKLLELTIHTDVVFEVDGYTDTMAWSVVVRGVAERLDRDVQIDEAWALPLRPWIPTLKLEWVRVHIREVSGRQFLREPEPQIDY